ncbi:MULTISPECIES: hypothetical protein [unclassified Mesorhizobium]|nr:MULTISPECIES: hypothetical protein [unclassified Mesorhizobium]
MGASFGRDQTADRGLAIFIVVEQFQTGDAAHPHLVAKIDASLFPRHLRDSGARSAVVKRLLIFERRWEGTFEARREHDIMRASAAGRAIAQP